MRSLTEAEARVIAVLLGAVASQERDRLHRLQIPRSTYHAARRRAYAERWVEDRYVPDPAELGRPRASFLLFRPFLDKAAELEALLTSDSSLVHLWTSPQVMLAVGFHQTDAQSEKILKAVESRGLASWIFPVVADVTGPGVPVYFDFEGMWGHLADFEGTVSYPLGLGGAFANGATPREFSDHQRWAAGELVHRPFIAEAQGRGGHLIGPFGLPFSQLKLLRTGAVVYRVFLNVEKLPPYRGRQGAQVVFITGTLRSGAGPEALFSTLTGDCRVFPFLWVVRDERILIGALGAAPSPTSTPAETLAPRRPVMPTLRSSLEGIEVVQESSAQFTAPLDHRYDRVVSRRG